VVKPLQSSPAPTGVPGTLKAVDCPSPKVMPIAPQTAGGTARNPPADRLMETGTPAPAGLGVTEFIVMAWDIPAVKKPIRRAISQDLTIIRFILILLKTKKAWKWK
jgi:hypothetical protein